MPAGRIDLTNQLLIAMPGMKDENFERSVVYLCEHTERGALGLVINKPIQLNLKSLFEKVELDLRREDLAEQPVFFGGPVQTERGFVLHERESDAESGYSSSLNIPGGLAMTTSKDVLEAIVEGKGPKHVFITLGYSGWSAGQLEDEIARNGWLNVESHRGSVWELIFDTPVELRYQRALALLGLNAGTLSHEAGHA